MLGYVVHLFWAVWEVVWYLVRMFILREPVSYHADVSSKIFALNE